MLSTDKCDHKMYNAKNKNDLMLILGLIIAAALLLIYMRVIRPKLRHSTSGLTAEITVDNKTVFSAAADELELPYIYELTTDNGGHNTFEIDRSDDGGVSISCIKADCPDKVCVDTGKVTLPDDPIVCLPHRVTARLYSTGK